jgi:hypothetical protein
LESTCVTFVCPYDPSYGTKTGPSGNLSALARYEDLYISGFLRPNGTTYGQTMGVEDMKLLELE